jgi:uncharacterized cofD-like protein
MKIVTIGGGIGQFTLLKSLRRIENIDITSVVSMVDSGGSTGRLRDEFGVLPPGDVLMCLIALSSHENARQVLQTRFKYNERLKNHNAGNLLLTFLAQYLSGDFGAAVEALGEILDVQGSVLPVTLDKATLAAELADGSLIFGESTIDMTHDSRKNKIKRVFLAPHHGEVRVNPRAAQDVATADHIIIGPGDLYTSIVPNFIVDGMKEAFFRTSAHITYVTNIMTKFTETDGFKTSDFVKTVENYIGKKVNMVICNNERPEPRVLTAYEKEQAAPVPVDVPDDWGGRLIRQFDLLTAGEFARHDPKKLAEAIKEVLGLE